MADIQFEEDQTAPPVTQAHAHSELSSLVCKAGLARDEAGAQRVLLIIFVLVVIAILIVVFSSGGVSASPHTPNLTP